MIGRLSFEGVLYQMRASRNLNFIVIMLIKLFRRSIRAFYC